MEQLYLDFNSKTDTIEDVYQNIVDCIEALDLPTDVLHLKTLMQTGAASVMVMEKIMCKIAIKQQGAFIQVRLRFQKEAASSGLEFEPEKSLRNYIRLPITASQTVQDMKPVLKEAFKIAYRENADTSFGCCSRFIECSDARKCTNPNHLFALGCAYKDNLENGRIFYGEHPTV